MSFVQTYVVPGIVGVVLSHYALAIFKNMAPGESPEREVQPYLLGWFCA